MAKKSQRKKVISKIKVVSRIDFMYEDFLRLSGLAPKKKKKKVISKIKAVSRIDFMYEDFLRLSGLGGKKVAHKKKKFKVKTKAKIPKGYTVSELYDEPTDDEPLELGSGNAKNTREYFADLFDGLGIDPADEEDSYRDTLKKSIASIARKFKKINDDRFLYNTTGDLQRRYSKILIHALIHSDELGYSVFSYTQNRGKKSKLTRKQWTLKLGRVTKRYGDSSYKVFTQKILPSINNRGGVNWRFISLLGWNGDNGLSKNKNTRASKRRYKTTKKRDSNARNSRRRR